MNQAELIAYLRSIVDRHGSQAEFARKHGLSRAYLNDVLTGKRSPAAKILKAIGVKRVVTYIKEGGEE